MLFVLTPSYAIGTNKHNSIIEPAHIDKFSTMFIIELLPPVSSFDFYSGDFCAKYPAFFYQRRIIWMLLILDMKILPAMYIFCSLALAFLLTAYILATFSCLVLTTYLCSSTRTRRFVTVENYRFQGGIDMLLVYVE